jgi:iron complex outermembrane recepter protein
MSMSHATAQTVFTGRVSCRITDVKDSSIIGATVALTRSSDSTIVKLSITGVDGSLNFEDVPAGNYYFRVTAIGFKKVNSNAFTVDTEHASIMVGSLKLMMDVSQLREVTVQARKPFIEHLDDRTVINVNNSIVSAGSTALEVLSRSPGVLVTGTDNIVLKGKPGVVVMIDGKPTNLSATDLANMLRSISASSIDKIELITNPSAKFDAAGGAGIINIRLKKDERFGMNGSVNGSFGQGIYDKISSGINMNYRNNKINIFGGYNYLDKKDYLDITFNRTFFENGVLDGGSIQHSFLHRPFLSHLLKAGLDYSPSKTTTIGFVVTGLYSQNNPNGTDNTDVLDSTATQKVSSFRTTSESFRPKHSYTGNLNFRHDLDTSGQAVTADVNYAHYGNNTHDNYTTDFFNLDGSPSQPGSISSDRNSGGLNIYAVKADYVLPLKGQASLETGFKTSYVKTDNNLVFDRLINNAEVVDSTLSNHFIYTENINALYVNFNKSFAQYKLRLGLRAEQTIAKGNQLTTDSSFRDSYIQLFPNLFFSDKLNDQNELNFSFGRRVDRPTYDQLNPFKFFLNPAYFIEGNPFLKPQFTYAGTLTYMLDQKYTFSVAYSNTTKDIILILAPDPAAPQTIIQQDQNLASFQIYTISLSMPFDPFKWWSSNNSFNAYYYIYRGDLSNTPLNSGKFAFDFNSTNSFIISNSTTAEINAAFTSGNIEGYVYFNHVFQLSAGIAQKVLKGRGILKLSIADPFRTDISAGYTNLVNYSDVFKRYSDSRYAAISFSYRFGNTKVAPSSNRESGVEEEKRRAKG